MEIVVGKKEENTTVLLDGKSFVDCEFTKCKLLFHGTGEVSWVNVIFNHCDIMLVGEAQRVANFLKNTGWTPPETAQMQDLTIEPQTTRLM